MEQKNHYASRELRYATGIIVIAAIFTGVYGLFAAIVTVICGNLCAKFAASYKGRVNLAYVFGIMFSWVAVIVYWRLSKRTVGISGGLV